MAVAVVVVVAFWGWVGVGVGVESKLSSAGLEDGDDLVCDDGDPRHGDEEGQEGEPVVPLRGRVVRGDEQYSHRGKHPGTQRDGPHREPRPADRVLDGVRLLQARAHACARA